MHCSGCVSRVEQALTGIDGVHKVSVDLNDHEATVMYEEDKAAVDDFKEAVESAGYTFEGVKETN